MCVKVWHLRLTIHCLADAGNMLDCACLAGIVALKHFRRPEVEVVGDEVTIVRQTISDLVSSVTMSSFVLASSLRTGPSAALHASYTVLLHFCVLLGPIYAGRP